MTAYDSGLATKITQIVLYTYARSEVGPHIFMRSNRKHLMSQTINIIAQVPTHFTTSHSNEASAHSQEMLVWYSVLLLVLS